MMKKISITFAIVVLSFVANTASAVNVWKNDTTINGIQALYDGSFILYLPTGSDSDCAEGRLFYVAPNQNSVVEAGVKNLLSASLVAYTTGKVVSIRYDNATTKCYVNEIVLK